VVPSACSNSGESPGQPLLAAFNCVANRSVIGTLTRCDRRAALFLLPPLADFGIAKRGFAPACKSSTKSRVA
jgi:hypothetical protein